MFRLACGIYQQSVGGCNPVEIVIKILTVFYLENLNFYCILFRGL